MESGLTRIAVPEHAGHNDLAMSLCLAFHPEAGWCAGVAICGIGARLNRVARASRDHEP
jgi:hypothetical protein